MKRLVLDIDNTICISNGDYISAKPIDDIVEAIKRYKESGFEIVLYTSRNMRTYNGSIGMINKHTLPTIIEWLKLNSVPYDEIHVGKPWCGDEGFYVDDRAIRPEEFAKMSYSEIRSLLKLDQ